MSSASAPVPLSVTTTLSVKADVPMVVEYDEPNRSSEAVEKAPGRHATESSTVPVPGTTQGLSVRKGESGGSDSRAKEGIRLNHCNAEGVSTQRDDSVGADSDWGRDSSFQGPDVGASLIEDVDEVGVVANAFA